MHRKVLGSLSDAFMLYHLKVCLLPILRWQGDMRSSMWLVKTELGA